MVRVRDVMSSELVTVSPELTLRDMVELLTDRHIGGAPVVARDRVLGVISASDVLAFEAATPGVPTERAEQAEWELETPEEWEEGAEAPGTFFSEWWADAGADVAERFEEIRGAEWDVLAEHTVAEAMSPSVCSVQPDTELAAAARYMLRRNIHRVLVMEEGKPVGILTTTDVVRAVAERRLG
ncbi:MAG TPA: CBS domain-containing protein [Gemmatimonadales bacterium]|nr:CBS domain-containing protein [Gemmatimonadales bacterium]